MKSNLIKDKSFAFSVRIVNLYRYLIKSKKEFVLSKQLLRSGTSIGANIEEAVGGQSKNDFISKLAVAYKESRETNYWIKLLKETKYLSDKEANSLLDDCEELIKIISKIQITAKSNN